MTTKIKLVKEEDDYLVMSDDIPLGRVRYQRHDGWLAFTTKVDSNHPNQLRVKGNMRNVFGSKEEAVARVVEWQMWTQADRDADEAIRIRRQEARLLARWQASAHDAYETAVEKTRARETLTDATREAMSNAAAYQLEAFRATWRAFVAAIPFEDLEEHARALSIGKLEALEATDVETWVALYPAQAKLVERFLSAGK